MARVSELHVYPVKGCAGVSVPSVALDARGPVGDRRFMIVDAQGMFITQRDTPPLALIRVQRDERSLTLSAPGMTAITLAIEDASRPRKEVQVWRSSVDAAWMGEPVAQWLSDYLHAPASLVHMDVRAERFASTDYAPANTPVGFADAYPILLISQASLDQLNAKLDTPLPMNRFRPNVVVSDTTPHAEDGWRQIRIGDVPLDVVKPCDRCTVTTVDQATAVGGKEPLRTLASYRRHDHKIYFGQNLVHRALGTLTVGMDVEILSSGAARPPL